MVVLSTRVSYTTQLSGSTFDSGELYNTTEWWYFHSRELYNTTELTRELSDVCTWEHSSTINSSTTIVYFKLARFTSQHSSTGSHTTVYFKLAHLSRRKGHNYADSQAHSQAGSQACRCLGWQKRGVSEIGEASPSSSGAKQKQFLPCTSTIFFF